MRLIVLLGICWPLSFPVWAETQIDVFTQHPISLPNIPDTQVRIWDLSRPDVVEATAPEFPYDAANPQRTVQLAQQWSRSPAGRKFHQEMRQAYEPMTTMFNCGIEKLPAIAFERCRYVVYGTTDLKQAVQDYDDFKRSRNKR